MAVRVLARQLGLERVDRESAAVVLSLGQKPRVTPDAVARLLGQAHSPWRLGEDLRLARHQAPAEAAEPLLAVLGALKALVDCATRSPLEGS